MKILVCANNRGFFLDHLHAWLLGVRGYTVVRGNDLIKSQTQYSGDTKFDLVIADALEGGGQDWLRHLQSAGQLVLYLSAGEFDESLPFLCPPFTEQRFLAKVASMFAHENSA